MPQPPDDLSTTDDLTLVRWARAGDRLSFGVLYLRHHAAAWRIACVSSRFSPDAELAVIDGFTRVFSALPRESEELERAGVTFRPYLLACVRQSALDRARAAGRSEAGGEPVSRRRSPKSPRAASAPPASLAGLTVDGEVRLSGLEHHVARGALAALPERARAALWLSDVEAMTPAEVAGIVGGSPEQIAALATTARAEINAVKQAALDRQEVRADCRFAAEHLAAYEAGTLDPAEGLLVRSHLSDCLTCRMRQKELGNTAAALAAAVPAAPLLGGETQHHWILALGDSRPAEQLLPPVLAAGGTVPRESLARRTAAQFGTVAGAASTVPDALRRAGRAAARPWQGDSIDLTSRARPSSARPAAPVSTESTGTAAGDPAGLGAPRAGSAPAKGAGSSPGEGPGRGHGSTTPPGWTGSPGRSGSPLPSLPPSWTVPPGRATGNRHDLRRDRRTRRAVGAGVVPAVAGAGPAGLSRLARRATRAARPVLPPVALAVAWVMVMMSLPRLLAPSTAEGPEGLALPAVQAFMLEYAPGAGPKAGSGTGRPAAPSSGRLVAPSGDTGRDPARSSDAADSALGAAPPSIALVAAALDPTRPGPARSRSGRPSAPAPSISVSLPPVSVPPVSVPPVSVAPVSVAAAATPGPSISLIPTVATAPTLDTPINPQLVPTEFGATARTPAAPVASRPKPKPDNPEAHRPKPDRPKADRAKARTEKTKAGRPSGTEAQPRRQPVKNGRATERKAQRPETVLPDKGKAKAAVRPIPTRSPRPRIFTA